MKKENQSLVLSGVALLFSIVAILVAYFRCEPMTADWMGILVGILSLLVTILIGWQIYSVMQVERKMNDTMTKAIDNMNDTIVKAIDDISTKIDKHTEASKEEAIGASLFNLGQVMFYNGSYEHALDNFIKAVKAINKSEMKDKDVHIEKCIQDIMITVDLMKKDIDKYSISERSLVIYSKILLELHDERVFTIMEFLRKTNRLGR